MTAHTGTLINRKDLISTPNDWWTASDYGTNEYYYNIDDLPAGSSIVYQNGSLMTEGTIGSLSAGEYAYGDNDSLGFTTAYIRLTENIDPDTQVFEYVQTSIQRDLIGTGNNWWTTSASGTNEYYYNIDDLDADADEVFEDGSLMVEGIVGSLAAGEFVFADNDTLGYTTIYVRLTDSVDPDTKDAEFIETNKKVNATSEPLNLWTASASGTNEYYYNVNDLSAESDTVYEDDVAMIEGTIGLLTAGQFVIGDNDTLGFDTVYVRLTDNTDPDTKAAEFIEINQWAHTLLIAFLKGICEAEGWRTKRYNVSGTEKELIMSAPGYSGTEEIYIGFKSFQSENNDYYNIIVMVSQGYAQANPWESQPGARYVTTQAHNYSITYWISVNANRINAGLKVGTPVYTHFGAGYFLPFAPPHQFPQPMFIGGMQLGESATRFSDTGLSYPWAGLINQTNFNIHMNDGEWHNGSDTTASEEIKLMKVLQTRVRPAEDNYILLPLYIHDTNNIYGELDGIYHITGFNNVVENTTTIDGDDYVILHDVYRTGFGDYIAFKLE